MPERKNTCPVPCNLKIEELKKWLEFTLNTLHDSLVDISDESEEWYESFYDEIETIVENVIDI